MIECEVENAVTIAIQSGQSPVTSGKSRTQFDYASVDRGEESFDGSIAPVDRQARYIGIERLGYNIDVAIIVEIRRHRCESVPVGMPKLVANDDRGGIHLEISSAFIDPDLIIEQGRIIPML
jgi:hypothetical protein